ncbi:PHP domain-containing protein [Clostridia bacterium]|nr:PHP domain-containing protein [Clostridia bacterium]
MIIDTHIHEKTFSKDSELGLLQIVSRSKQLGLHGICITDHESNGIAPLAKYVAKELDFPIIVGAEVYSDLGDILCFGLDEVPAYRIPAQQLLDTVKRAGGTTIAAHPYRNNNRGLKDYLMSVNQLGAIEAFNGSTGYMNNMRALKVAESIDLPVSGASDAHYEHKLGTFATWFPDGVRTSEDLVEAIRTKQIHPMAYINGCYQDIETYIESGREMVG